MADFKNANYVLDDAVLDKAFPGAVGGVTNEKETLFLKAAGHSRLVAPERAMETGDIFDLASLTKPVAAATALLRLVHQGRVSLDEPVSHYIKGWRRSYQTKVSLRHLLTHTSGIPGWYPTYTEASNPQEVLELLCKLDFAYPTGTLVQYSCLNFILLGLIVERITGQSLDEASQELVFAPLQMKETAYKPLQRLDIDPNRIVLHESGSAVEKAMTKRGGFSFDNWRQDYAIGMPNDGNSSYAMGGVSGNAGLFGSAGDLLAFGRAWLKAIAGRESHFLSPALAKLAASNQTPGLKPARGLGWLLYDHTPVLAEGRFKHDWNLAYWTPPAYLKPEPRSHGELLSPGSFGHTGFTGQSLWIDPEKGIAIVLLTNHLHAEAKLGLMTLRARFHNAIISDLGL